MAVDDVEAQQEGHAEAQFLDREALDGMDLVRAPVIEQASDPSRSNPFIDVAELAGTGNRSVEATMSSCPIFSSIVIVASSVSMRPMLLPCPEPRRMVSTGHPS